VFIIPDRYTSPENSNIENVAVALSVLHDHLRMFHVSFPYNVGSSLALLRLLIRQVVLLEFSLGVLRTDDMEAIGTHYAQYLAG
jgi:hypothetical protein